MEAKYFVNAAWDEEAQVFYSKGDIRGLHIEAETLDEFESLTVDLAPDLIVENHLSAEEVSTTPLRDLIPSIVLRETQPNRGAGVTCRTATTIHILPEGHGSAESG